MVNEAEHLVVIHQSVVAVVHDHLEADGALLPHQQLHLLAGFQVGVSRVVEVAFHLCRCHDAVALFVDVYVYDVAFAHLHAHFLLAEGTEQVFHESPFQERTILVYPCHLKAGKLAHLGNRMFGCCHQSLIDVEIQEHLYLVANVCSLRHIAFG